MPAKGEVSILTLNIEGGEFGPHAEKQANFFDEIASQGRINVIAMQEVFECQMDKIKERLGMQGHFLPSLDMKIPTADDRIRAGGRNGSAIFSNLPIRCQGDFYYSAHTEIPVLTEPGPFNPRRGIVWLEVETYSGSSVKVGSMHHTWTWNGKMNLVQLADFRRMRRQAAANNLDVIAGDSNAPITERLGRHMISRVFQTYIPDTWEGTIDTKNHRHSNIPRHLVDMILLTHYSSWRLNSKSVDLIKDVSDHYGVVGTIQRE
jgi:endonuclease/exonuclease/phosphatase family metal-dependent hydrolase